MTDTSHERPAQQPTDSRPQELQPDSAYEAPQITRIGSLREVRTGNSGGPDGAPFKRKP